MDTREDLEGRVADLYRSFADGRLSRRDFMNRSTALGVAGAATSVLSMLAAGPTAAQIAAAASTAANAMPVDLAEWSYFWLGVTRARLARGTLTTGEQMYVEYWTPAEVKHPYPIVLVHGGGGQGLDWLGTADGRPGWVRYLLAEGWKVYLVDRPGHGRSPYAPDMMGAWPAQAATYETLERQFTAPEKAAQPYGPQARLHTQWPGTGVLGDPALDQLIPGQGGAFLPDLAATHAVWAKRGAELLDKIGPAVVMAHSMGGPSLWLYANARPALVKGLVGVEPGGPPFGNFTWGLTASPMDYDPPIKDPSELKLVDVPAQAGRAAGKLQAEPARKLKALKGIPIAVVTSPASYHWPYDLHSVAYLRQAGASVDHIELEKIGVTGNAHFMMHEKNHAEVLAPITQWLEAKVSAPARKAGARPRPVRSADPTDMKLADMGFFWVGTERKTMPYGVISRGAMYVQYLIPAVVKHQTPIVLVHAGTGQMLHYMGPGDGLAGWAHYYVRQGYKVYLVDRPGHGRVTYHPDALGPSNPIPTYEWLAVDFRRARPGGRLTGTGDIGDPALDQLVASQNPSPQDYAMVLGLWRSRGVELLERIGPAVIQTHSAGAPYGWLVADARPDLVKAVVTYEGASNPLITGQPPVVTPLPNLKGMPIAYFSAPVSGRTQGPAIVAALNASGARAEHIAFIDRGIAGNSHFAMLETNRREVFDVIEGWVAKTVG